MELFVKSFNELSAGELYALLKLRVDVFVVEQKCAYHELDGLDADALHVYYTDSGEVAAYLRVLPRGAMFDDAVGIGRVIAAKRGVGLGAKVLGAGIDAARERFGADIVLRGSVFADKDMALPLAQEEYTFVRKLKEKADAGS